MSEPSLSPPPEPASRLARWDLRTSARFPCGLNTFCQVSDPKGGKLGSAWVRDVSATGVGLFLDRRHPPGTVLALELANRRRRFACRVLVRVVHSSVELPNGSWLHGAAFSRPLSGHELQSLLP